MAVIVYGVTEEASLISVAKFCDELHRATLHGSRDDQGAEGEALWELYDELRKQFPVNCKVCAMLPCKTVDEVVTTVEELMRRAEILGHKNGVAALKKRFTSVPPSIAMVRTL